MKKFLRWLELWLPYVWGMLWIVIITALSCGAAAWVIRWFLAGVGVM